MTAEDILREIDRKLDVIVRLLASRLIEGKNQTESILLLGGFGLDRNLIADIARTKPATVSTRLSEAKKKTRSSRKKPQDEGESQ